MAKDKNQFHSLRKSDAAIFNAIMKSVKEKLRYMETVFHGPKKRRRRKKKSSPKKKAVTLVSK